MVKFGSKLEFLNCTKTGWKTDSSVNLILFGHLLVIGKFFKMDIGFNEFKLDTRFS